MVQVIQLLPTKCETCIGKKTETYLFYGMRKNSFSPNANTFDIYIYIYIYIYISHIFYIYIYVKYISHIFYIYPCKSSTWIYATVDTYVYFIDFLKPFLMTCHVYLLNLYHERYHVLFTLHWALACPMAQLTFGEILKVPDAYDDIQALAICNSISSKSFF
jgi:hypothetical protein